MKSVRRRVDATRFELNILNHLNLTNALYSSSSFLDNTDITLLRSHGLSNFFPYTLLIFNLKMFWPILSVVCCLFLLINSVYEADQRQCKIVSTWWYLVTFTASSTYRGNIEWCKVKQGLENIKCSIVLLFIATRTFIFISDFPYWLQQIIWTDYLVAANG